MYLQVCLSPFGSLSLMDSLHSFCTSDNRKKTFPKTYENEVGDLLDKWGKWVAVKGNKLELTAIHLLTLPCFF